MYATLCHPHHLPALATVETDPVRESLDCLSALLAGNANVHSALCLESLFAVATVCHSVPSTEQQARCLRPFVGEEGLPPQTADSTATVHPTTTVTAHSTAKNRIRVWDIRSLPEHRSGASCRSCPSRFGRLHIRSKTPLVHRRPVRLCT